MLHFFLSNFSFIFIPFFFTFFHSIERGSNKVVVIGEMGQNIFLYDL